jgi:hypothetical protein
MSRQSKKPKMTMKTWLTETSKQIT